MYEYILQYYIYLNLYVTILHLYMHLYVYEICNIVTKPFDIFIITQTHFSTFGHLIYFMNISKNSTFIFF